MVFKKGRKGGKRRGYGRKAAKRVARGLAVGPRLFGFTKGGLKVGRAVMAGSALSTMLVQGYADANSSPIEIIMGKGPGASATGTQKVKMALGAIVNSGLGWGITDFACGKTYNASNKGICGVGVAAGVALTMAGKFANPMLSGSPVKL